MFCKNCGKELPEDATFCGECGKKIEMAKNDVLQEQPSNSIRENKNATTGEQSDKSIVGLIIILCIVVTVTLVAGVIYYLYDSGYFDDIFELNISSKRIEMDEEKLVCNRCGGEKIDINGRTICLKCDVAIEDDEEDDNEEIDKDVDSDYLFPSDRVLITAEDLAGMTADEVALIRNEIYARHGYIFQTEKYQKYFEAKNWYQPNENFTADSLNSIENANKDFLVKYETDMGWR